MGRDMKNVPVHANFPSLQSTRANDTKRTFLRDTRPFVFQPRTCADVSPCHTPPKQNNLTLSRDRWSPFFRSPEQALLEQTIRAQWFLNGIFDTHRVYDKLDNAEYLPWRNYWPFDSKAIWPAFTGFSFTIKNFKWVSPVYERNVIFFS